MRLARFRCSLTRPLRLPVNLRASKCSICCTACWALAGRILLRAADIGRHHVQAIMAQLLSNHRSRLPVDLFRCQSLPRNNRGGMPGDDLITLTGIGSPHIVKTLDGDGLWDVTPLTVGMVTPLGIGAVFGGDVVCAYSGEREHRHRAYVNTGEPVFTLNRNGCS